MTAMTAIQHTVGEADDRFHQASLRARPQQRDAILYACEQMHAAGTEPTGPEVRQWLTNRNRKVGRTTVWQVVKEYRTANGLPDLDDERGLFADADAAAGGVNTEQDSEQTTEQPSGAISMFTPERNEAAAGPVPAAAADSSQWGRSEQPNDVRRTVNTADGTTEHRHLGIVNTPPAIAEHSEPEPTPVVPIGAISAIGRIWKTRPSGATVDRTRRALPVWPVLVMAFPAFVAIWSGWVGLGELTGFGVVHPLPGIADSFTINSAITLPIGVEAYASYALYVWLSGRIERPATRRYAMLSAAASLLVGAAGQVAYHVMEARHITSAPWQIITMVACLPVAVVGMGAVLAHLVVHERHAMNA